MALRDREQRWNVKVREGGPGTGIREEYYILKRIRGVIKGKRRGGGARDPP